ncbi:L-histidine N(alpha)-methyltransferase [Rhizorhabdus argentea]|uniref:L-histidine N(alpha)-methyltransferase n=1 Tax=Rhizorhabdus argentea TaxID=1387174 RepID=UPI0030EB16B8
MLLDTSRTRVTVDPHFRADVLAGLAMRPQRMIPPRWFYDLRGSELFEDITRVPEYYPTRTEVALLDRHCSEISKLVGPGRAVVEFGSGSSAKTPILLDCVEPAAYVPIDICGEFLRQSTAMIADTFPELPVLPLEGDFTRPLATPDAIGAMPKLGFFPGSTIGNMTTQTAVDLLRSMRTTLGAGAMLLIGIDRLKEEDTLVRAYDDAQGVTAAFNLNLFERINRELDGDIPIDAFDHLALWNAWEMRIEMHLEAKRDVIFTVDGRRFAMAAGETVHTENSHKYGVDGARVLLRAGSWAPIREWTDPDGQFGLILAEAEAAVAAI